VSHAISSLQDFANIIAFLLLLLVKWRRRWWWRYWRTMRL